MSINILGTGAYLPTKIITNNNLAKTLDTSDEWILAHTGIKQRHIAENFETTTYMAHKASIAAMKESNLTPKDIDLIIVATTTHEQIFPACATKLQSMLGCTCPAFDIQAVCAGFIFAMATAHSYIVAKQAKTILIVGVDKMSNIIDWSDRSTCILFGDGAGSLIVEYNENNKAFFHIQSDGNFHNILYADIKQNQLCKLQMNGQAVFKHAVTKMAESIKLLLHKAEKTTKEIDWFVPHQANIRIIDSLAQKIAISKNKIISTIEKHANTSAASIPLAINYAHSQKLFITNQLIMCSAIGGGLSWGSALFQW